MPDDGGPAFPRPTSSDEHSRQCNNYDAYEGMSLHDHFAGLAMKAIRQNNDTLKLIAKEAKAAGESGIHRYIAIMAGEQADAMLEERRRRETDARHRS